MSYDGWTNKALSESPVEIIDGDRGKNYPNGDALLGSGYCLFLNAKNVTENGFVFDQTIFITREKDAALRKGKLKRHDIVLTTRGTVGNVAYYDDIVSYSNIRINSGMVILRTDPEQLYPPFLYWVLRSSFVQDQIRQLRTGSAQPQLPISILNRVSIPSPPLPEQHAIAATLSCLDDKIELNNRMNKTLEEMAQAIFKSWFVDFEPFQGGEFVDSELGRIPKGWRVGAFTELVDIVGGGTPKTDVSDFWNGSIPFFTPKDVTNSLYTITTEKTLSQDGLAVCNSKLFPINTVFVTARGTVGKLALAGKPMAMNQSCYALIGKEGLSNFYVYLLTQSVVASLKAKASGAVFDAIVTRDFVGERVVIPTLSCLDEFHAHVVPIFHSIYNNAQQNLILSETRDALLPRLVSGTLRLAVEA